MTSQFSDAVYQAALRQLRMDYARYNAMDDAIYNAQESRQLAQSVRHVVGYQQGQPIWSDPLPAAPTPLTGAR